MKNVLYTSFLVFALTQIHSIIGRRVKRVVGGNVIKIEDAPYMIALEYFNKQICGGAILNENWILTAAHCFGKKFYIDFGVVRVGTDFRQEGGTEHRLLNVIKYPNFRLNIVDNDVALMKVYPPLKYSEKVQPIGLEVFSQPRVGEMLTVLGWGYTEEKGEPSDKLRAVSVPVYPHEECVELYRTTLNVTSQMLCVGFQNGGRDACILDSGGPLVSGNAIVGLVSWGWGCARALHPGVYTNLSAPQVRNWILSVIGTK